MPCDYFERRGVKTVSLDTWFATHDPHSTDHYGKSPLEHAPDDYPASWLVCQCGARILINWTTNFGMLKTIGRPS